MLQFKIQGGNRLSGEVAISGAKNAALPLLCASLLSDSPCLFHRVPRLSDVETMLALLRALGAEVNFEENQQVEVRAPLKVDAVAPYDLVRTMRASILVLGPLLTRYGYARVSLPGGCAIGARPVDVHLKGLRAMGAKIDIHDGYIEASAPKGLVGAKVICEKVSVTGTENLLMAACLAEGETCIENAAQEPEIVALAQCLRGMGAYIRGEGTAVIHCQGVKRLKSCEFTIPGDRIEAGTYLLAGLVTGGEVTVRGVVPAMMDAVTEKLSEMGADVQTYDDAIRLSISKRPQCVDIHTSPYPGFPTDMQAQLMVGNAIANGRAVIRETIFENRFMHVPELIRMGADIQIEGNAAIVRGVQRLKAAPVMATDLRASSSLVLAGLRAEGTTVVDRAYHIDRGYERIAAKLQALGAQIERQQG